MTKKFIKFHTDMNYNGTIFHKGSIHELDDTLGFATRWLKRGCESVTKEVYEKFLEAGKKKEAPVIIPPKTPEVVPPAENKTEESSKPVEAPQAPASKPQDDDDLLAMDSNKTKNTQKAKNGAKSYR